MKIVSKAQLIKLLNKTIGGEIPPKTMQSLIKESDYPLITRKTPSGNYKKKQVLKQK